MATFAAHVIVHGETGSVQFAPGDEVPEWAVDQVGAHVLEPEETAPEEADEHDGQDQDEDVEGDGEDDTPPPADDQPDFTAPTPARRGRSRKQ